MKCMSCGKDYDQELERAEFNKKHSRGPSYDERGLNQRRECLACREKRLGEFAKELSARIG